VRVRVRVREHFGFVLFAMAFLLKWFWNTLAYLGLYNRKAKIIFLGLDNSGKTTLLHMLRDDKVIVHQPTKHAQSEELLIGNISFKTHDLGGHKAARRLWPDYFANIDGVVFMVDSTDIKRFPECKKELSKLLTHDTLAQVPFMVLGNKIDLKTAVSENQLRRALGLEETTGKKAKVPDGIRPIETFMCSVVKRAGYEKGFRWLAKFLK